MKKIITYYSVRRFRSYPRAASTFGHEYLKYKWKIALLLCSKPFSTPVLSESP